jgi:uncharacterized protein
MIKLKQYILLLLTLISFAGTSQTDCFPKPKDFTFVYDEANILSEQQEATLNNKLRAFTNSTSNVLVIVTKTDLCGYDKAKYTYTCLEEMGVGRADLDNGLVIMVKPKEIDGVGEVFIATGKGLQGAIPDLVASRDIVQKELIPQFKLKNYYQGISNASDVLIALASGEISHEDYAPKKSKLPVIIFIGIFIILFVLAQKYGKGGDDWEDFGSGGKNGGRSSLPFWLIAGSMMGGGSRGGSGGFGGGSSGGFGGFGGGGSFGGGAGGSW